MTDDEIIRTIAAAGAAYAAAASEDDLRSHYEQVCEVEKYARAERRATLRAAAAEMRFRLERKIAALEAESRKHE